MVPFLPISAVKIHPSLQLGRSRRRTADVLVSLAPECIMLLAIQWDTGSLLPVWLVVSTKLSVSSSVILSSADTQ